MSISVGRMQNQYQQQQQQQNHINELLSTAAAGNGVVNDVDALLTPIEAPVSPPPQRTESRPERNLWRTEEIHQMLNFMQQINAIELLNDKSVKSEKVFRNIEKMMHQSGYRKKSHVQIWTKWKFLKSTYMTSRRNSTTPRMISHSIYEALHKMLCTDGTSLSAVGAASGHNSECGNSIASLDGDGSNGAADAGSGTKLHMVISDVEGGYTNGKAKSGPTEEADESAQFGMAHPIFGFRLGLVKQEPADTGYETITDNGITYTSNNSSSTEKDSLFDESNTTSTANIQFRTEIKQEVEEEPPTTITPFVVATVAPSNTNSTVATTTTQRLRHKIMQTALEKQPELLKPIANSASTQTQTAPSMVTTRQPAQLPLPPLRIAPFAKEPSIHAMQIRPDRPPPSLTVNPSNVGRPTRIQIFQNPGGSNLSNANSMLPRKILPKPVAQTTITPIRLSREITVQTRGTTAAATAAVTAAANAAIPALGGMPRLKHVPIRQTPYLLRPDRMIPDLEDPASSPSPPYEGAYEERPTTSRQALAATLQTSTPLPRNTTAAHPALALNKRKRRLDLPWPSPTTEYWNTRDGHPIVNKKQRLTYPHANIQSQFRQEKRLNADEDDDIAATQRQSFRAAQQQPPPLKLRAGINLKSTQREHELYESALKDLGTSLRQMQREMITEFFEQQMELARKEHDFQMKQDVLIMQAFEEQTRHIMTTAREMLGLELRDLSVGGENEEEEEEKEEEKAQSAKDHSNDVNREKGRYENKGNKTERKINRERETANEVAAYRNDSRNQTIEAETDADAENENEDEDEDEDENNERLPGDPEESEALVQNEYLNSSSHNTELLEDAADDDDAANAEAEEEQEQQEEAEDEETEETDVVVDDGEKEDMEDEELVKEEQSRHNDYLDNAQVAAHNRQSSEVITDN